MFDKLLLVSCICIVVASIIYFFYWNRFLGFLIGRVIRLLSWNKEASSIWVEIGSIHFSIVAGRILFKDVKYYSSNQTIKVVKGQIQWRYWIRRPTSEEEIGLDRIGEDAYAPSKQCRVHLSLQGLEWFLYNKTAAYEYIISRMQEQQGPDAPTVPLSQKASRGASSTPFPPFITQKSRLVPNWLRQAASWLKQQLPELDPKDLLPLGIEVQKGVIVCGNASTANLLVAEFNKSDGTFGVVETRCKLDLYKQMLSLKFHKAEMRLVENEDYVDPMTSLGELAHGRIHQYSLFSRPFSYLSHHSFVKLWDRLGLFALTKRYARDRRESRNQRQPSQSRARRMFGRSSRSEPTTDSTINEYAIERKILETPLLELTYYYDVAGEVVPETEESTVHDTPPEWGFNIAMTEAVIRYGPWADRQRAEIQRIFFPLGYQDSVITKPSQPGDTRPWAALQIFLEFNGGATLHIPFREASKDWQWDEKSQIKHQQPREPATIHLSVGDRTTMNYTLPMIVDETGYNPVMDFNMDNILMTSTLNDIRLVAAESCRIHGEFPSPVRWDDERTWSIGVSFSRSTLYLIRDHINMFTDLIKDWTAGPPTDYQRFIPTIYAFKFDFYNYDINLYVNDHNIIDKPLLREENAIIAVSGAQLKVSTDIFSNQYRPDSTSVPFCLDAPDVYLSQTLPRWNTNAMYEGKNGNSLARIGNLSMQGYYRYFAVVRDDAIEQLNLQFKLTDVRFKALGWAIRYFMVLRENYFGSFTNFSTLYEYLEKRRLKRPLGDPVMEKYRPGKSNMLQVEIQLAIENGLVLLPASLTGSDSFQSGSPEAGPCLALVVPEIQLQLRIHDYYMDMSVNTSAIAGGILQNYSSLRDIKPREQEMQALQIDGLHITANRMFGPAPHTSTYVCIWEIAVDHVRAKPSASDARVILAALNAFRINYSDIENAPAQEYGPFVEPDVTFVRVSVQSLNATWIAGRAALILSLPSGLAIGSNDLGGRYHRKVTTIKVPEITVQVLLTTAAHSARNRWLEAARITCDVYLDIYRSPADLEEASRLQAEYISSQDARTGRGKLMVKSLAADRKSPRSVLHKDGLYLPHPRLPDQSRPTSTPARSAQKPARKKAMVVEGQDAFLESDAEEDGQGTVFDTKPLPPRFAIASRRPAQDIDQEMSSGDESDDEDLTDASSDSEWTDPPSPSRLSPEDTACKLYSNVVDQYTYESSPNTLSSMDGQPFHRLRVSALLSSLRGSKGELLSTSNDDYNDDSDPQETTNLRLKSKNGVDIVLTPLVVFAGVHFEEDIRHTITDPGLWIDSLMVDYLGKFKTSGRGETSLHYYIQLPSISLAILQRIIADQGRPIISESSSSKESIGDIGLDVIVVIQAAFEGVDIRGFNSGSKSASSVICSRSFMDLDLSIDKRTISFPRPSQFLLGCSIDAFNFELSDGQITVCWDDFTSRLGHLGPEYIVATFVALSSTSRDLANVISPLLKHHSNAKKTVVAHIIQASKDRATIDPLSTIQPSYLVQTGRPFSLRTDVVFRFLYHLRVCLWHLPSNYDSWSSPTTQTIPNEELLSLVEDRLTALDPDAYTANCLISLDELIHLGLPPSSIQQHQPSFKGRIELKHLALTIVDPAGRSSSELSVSNLCSSIMVQTGELQRQPTHPASISQTSLKDRRHQKAINAWISVSCDDFYLSICPHLMSFVQNLLRVRRFWYSSDASESRDKPRISVTPKSTFQSVIATVNLKQLRVQAAAENLMFELAVKDILVGSNIVNRSQSRHSMSHTISFEDISLRARSPSHRHRDDTQDILAYASLIQGKINAAIRGDPTEKMNRIFFTTGLQLSVPRSALKLYQFVEEWRADYLPGMEAMIQALVTELNKAPSTKPKPAPGPSPAFEVHGHFSHLGISLQVMHGTWLSWTAKPSIGYAKSIPQPNSTAYDFGGQIGPMALEISPGLTPTEKNAGTRIKLSLPSIMVTGRHQGNFVRIMGLVEEIDLKVKLSHWDTLLVVQQKFGQDFNDLIALVHKTQSSRQSKPPPNGSAKKKALKYGGFLKIQGFRLALEGPASTAYLECLDIGGGINNETGRKWNINLSDLTLSLAAHNILGTSHLKPTRTHRPAFVTMDISTKGGERHGNQGETQIVNSIHVGVTKIHAVLQPSSIGQLGDFVDYLQVEILARKEQRVLELAAFKEKTRSVLKTFEVGAKDLQTEKRSWLDQYVIEVSARNIGVAFPLSLDANHGLSSSRTSRNIPSVPAFLWTIKSIQFSTHHAETGHFTMKGFALQFVSKFVQSDPLDYTADKHKTRNQLVYPEMEAQLTSVSTTTSRQVRVGANVSGFILDIDSSIPSYVFSLIDVYRLGKERVDKLSASLPRSPLDEGEHLIPLRQPTSKATLSSSNISGSLVFASGKVRLYSKSASKQWHERSSGFRPELSDVQVMTELGADVFNLPVVSLWTDYSATNGLDNGHGEASLMFKATIHSSQNILRPNLLPFMTEIVNHIETRMRKQHSALTLTALTPVIETPVSPDTPVLESAPASLRITFSLRIDQSKLELTCQPDVNVVAGLHWNSGGFIINVSPGAQDISFTGTVGGLTIGLKHGFLSEDCVKLDARNLAFSVGVTKGQAGDVFSHSVSAVIETEFLGGVRFSRLQDILCFKAVWLDRIPVFNGQSMGHSRESSRTPITPRPPQMAAKPIVNTVVLVRIRQITLEADLGQSISLLTLDLQDATLRTRLTNLMNEVSVSVDSFAINAKGNLSGYAKVQRCVFETTRSNLGDPAQRAAEGKMLELYMTSGPLVVSLESDHQQLLHYRAEPLRVNIFDDWSVKRDKINTRDTPLRLAFTVDSPEIVAVATIATIPKLLAYLNKFQSNLEAQRQGAARESKTFRITRTPKPDNPLSAVAEAMLHSARSRFKEMGTGLSYVIIQHMSLHLDLLRLIVFPRTMDDLEIAHFVGRDVKARFDRLVESDEPSGKRDLLLSFSSISISKHSGLGHPPPAETITKEDWLASLLSQSSEAIIVGLPTMVMHMHSEEKIEEQTRVLEYDFHSKFVRHEGLHEEKDIYITLNMSLYSWLTLLRKSLTREMEQVRIANDWNSLLNVAPTEASKIKKAVPEPLNLVDTPDSTPEHISIPQFSPFSPTTALRSSTGLSPGIGILSAGPSPRHNTMPSMEMSMPPPTRNTALVYRPLTRHIERLRMRQLGEATPDVMHPFFMKKAGFSLEDSLPQYVNEYATVPLEEIMEFLLKLYSRQLLANRQSDLG